jgi:hypothetical protein
MRLVEVFTRPYTWLISFTNIAKAGRADDFGFNRKDVASLKSAAAKLLPSDH